MCLPSQRTFTGVPDFGRLSIYHKLDATIRGHVFCSFLALALKSELDARIVELFRGTATRTHTPPCVRRPRPRNRPRPAGNPSRKAAEQHNSIIISVVLDGGVWVAARSQRLRPKKSDGSGFGSTCESRANQPKLASRILSANSSGRVNMTS
jgi:hypothetical protein